MRAFAGIAIYRRFSSYRAIKTAVDAALRSQTITFANPAKRNTLSFDTLTELSSAIKDVKGRIANKEVRVHFGLA